MPKSKRTKACDISQIVKEIVYERDHGLCIFCGKMGLPNAHFIPRSHGGLGIEQNIVTACIYCHNKMDNSPDRKMYLDKAERYLLSIYKNWSKNNLVYQKYKEI